MASPCHDDLPSIANEDHAKAAAISSRRVQAYFFLFGTAVLLPWNCALSVMEFMDIVVFPGHDWTLVVTPLYNSCAVGTQLVMLFIGQFFTTWKLIALSLPFGVLSCAAVTLTLYESLFPEANRYVVGLVGCVGIAVAASGMLQSSVCEFCAKLMAAHGPLPAHYSNGLAAAGVISFIVANVVSAVASQGLATKVLFILSGAALLCCLLALVDLVRTGTVSFTSSLTSSSSDITDTQEVSNPAEITMDITPLPAGSSISEGARNISLIDNSHIQSPVVGHVRLRNLSNASWSSKISRESLGRVSNSVRRAWQQELNLVFIYAQTLFVFPAVCLKWVPPDGMTTQETYGLIMVSTYQVFDLLGRLLCTSPAIVRNCFASERLWILLLLRTLLLPLFFLCWLAPNFVFGSAILQIILVSILAISNGALTNLAFTAGSSDAPDEDRDIVGRALPLCVGIGIVIGSTAGSVCIPLFANIV